MSAFWVMVAPLGNDALVYRAGAAGLLGGDPWAATVNGYSYAAPPLQAVPFLPFLPLPEPVFLGLWLALTLAAGVSIARRFGWTFLLYPPLVIGMILGNPAIVGMAALLAGYRLVGVILRPQLLLVSGRAFLAFGLLSALGLALRPDYLEAVSSVAARYAGESLGVNFWGTPLMVPAGIALAVLCRKDRNALWLVMPAIGPAMGWYGYAMVLPMRSRWLAVACCLPVPMLGAAAITVYAVATASAPLPNRYRERGRWRHRSRPIPRRTGTASRT